MILSISALFIVTMLFLALSTPRMFDFSPNSALLNVTESP